MASLTSTFTEKRLDVGSLLDAIAALTQGPNEMSNLTSVHRREDKEGYECTHRIGQRCFAANLHRVVGVPTAVFGPLGPDKR